MIIIRKDVTNLLKRYGWDSKDMTQLEVKQALDIIIDLTVVEAKQILGGNDET